MSSMGCDVIIHNPLVDPSLLSGFAVLGFGEVNQSIS